MSDEDDELLERSFLGGLPFSAALGLYDADGDEICNGEADDGQPPTDDASEDGDTLTERIDADEAAAKEAAEAGQRGGKTAPPSKEEREANAAALLKKKVDVFWDWQANVQQEWYPATITSWRWKEHEEKIEHLLAFDDGEFWIDLSVTATHPSGASQQSSPRSVPHQQNGRPFPLEPCSLVPRRREGRRSRGRALHSLSA